jgi:cytoskeletal protein RodZ
MDNYTDQKPKSGAGLERKSDITVNQSSFGSNSTLVYIVVALVLIFGALLLFTGNWGTTTTAPTVTQENTTVTPAPATPPAAESTAPAPATPPAAESTAPAPATPPAAESTTPPATGTQPPAAPAQ